jgi:hypothetical protein
MISELGFRGWEDFTDLKDIRHIQRSHWQKAQVTANFGSCFLILT